MSAIIQSYRYSRTNKPSSGLLTDHAVYCNDSYLNLDNNGWQSYHKFSFVYLDFSDQIKRNQNYTSLNEAYKNKNCNAQLYFLKNKPSF